MDKIQFVNNSQPAINDTNLNQMQNNIEKAIKGTTLYDNEIGTNGGITFNENIQEGDNIEIIYCRRRTSGTSIYKSSGRIPYIEGMEVALDINYFANSQNQQNIAKSITVNNQGITVNGENSWGNVVTFGETNTIYITKVIKYI